ncbi:hypothetical protein GCM10020220_040270 [Nonomuraea rubra]
MAVFMAQLDATGQHRRVPTIHAIICSVRARAVGGGWGTRLPLIVAQTVATAAGFEWGGGPYRSGVVHLRLRMRKHSGRLAPDNALADRCSAVQGTSALSLLTLISLCLAKSR